jgi:hypothetical protein
VRISHFEVWAMGPGRLAWNIHVLVRGHCLGNRISVMSSLW